MLNHQPTLTTKEPDLTFKETCNIGCGTTFKMKMEDTDIEVPYTHTLPLIEKKCPKVVETKLMFRQKYAQIILQSFGSSPKYEFDGNLIPSRDEALEWNKRNQCKIGTICEPTGECWGSGSDACRSETTDKWVDGRVMKYSKLQWSTVFREACTMDWSCSIKKQTMQITTNERGEPTTIIDGVSTKLDTGANLQYIKTAGFGLLIEEPINCESTVVQANCFESDSKMYCEIKSSEGTRYVTMNLAHGCTSWGHSAYCTHGGIPQLLKGTRESPASTLSDLDEIRSAISVNNKILSKNFFAARKEMNTLKNQLIKVIINLIPENPRLLNGITGENTYTRTLGENMVESCSCKSKMSCEARQKHHPELTFCATADQKTKAKKSKAKELK